MVAGTLSFWFGWGNPPDTPDPAGYLRDSYHSSGTNNLWGTNKPGGLVVEGLDAQLDLMSVTYDREERREIVYDIQRRAAQTGCLGVMYYFNGIEQILQWPYFHTPPPSPVLFGQHYKYDWLDQDDPSFQGRPA
jgi:ABC-type transport system substrate-binding protein